MFKREEYDLEFKEKIVKTFLKTVSAFSNYNDGIISMKKLKDMIV